MLFQSYDYIALCYLAMSVNRNKPIFLNTAFLLVDIWIDFYTTIWQKRLLLNLAIHEDFFYQFLYSVVLNYRKNKKQSCNVLPLG